MEEKSTALVTTNYNLPATEHMAQAFAEEMDGLQITFDRVKIPSGGGLAFEVPGDDSENPDVVKELVGVIIDHYPVNAYWADKYSGQNNPPDCSSMDGKMGTNGTVCRNCRFNQWGSGEDGKSKACKNMHRIYLLSSGQMFPLLLTLPPTSLKNLSDYLAKRVISKGHRSYEVLTKITLKKATSGTGIAYSQAHFSLAGVLSAEVANQAQQIAEQYKPLTRAMALMTDDYAEPTSSYDVPDDDEDDGDLPF